MMGTSRLLTKVSDEIRAKEVQLQQSKAQQGCLIIKSANTWINEAKNRPIPNMLFSEFWYETELCILFADTNIGKSILAVQIADSISRGVAIRGFKLEVQPKKVLYLDFELSDKQFENRCSQNYTNHYQFNSNLLRAELNTEFNLPKDCKNVEEFLTKTLEKTIVDNGISVVVVDNLTFLKTDNERAKDALELMKFLKYLTKNNGVSILVLAHTPKRNSSNPITKNDLAGSKMLMNFCDSSFAIGASSLEPSLRYLIQIKQRNTEHLYHSGNIVVCRLAKESNFLSFQFEEFGAEQDHLKETSFSDISERDDRMKALISEGLSNVKIAEELGLSEGAIRKRRKALGL
ncbi:AAA family ATPase [Aestuariibaculum sp. YM273]|uniref:AAA family ATPase n=1 Tax=Aestuariibaculum sp. YM273 TaxID=3070659 RepID=UPI0027DBB0A1|nr:AAA family ATPase [Aestuariibaculum sp. YM273]WMI64085.1 AAA family ATPase [Aestuariibaculum sp. YM273]